MMFLFIYCYGVWFAAVRLDNGFSFLFLFSFLSNLRHVYGVMCVLLFIFMGSGRSDWALVRRVLILHGFGRGTIERAGICSEIV